MVLIDLYNKITDLILLTKLNSLVDSATGKRLAYFNAENLISVNEEISSNEYEDTVVFIRKLLNKQPLMKAGAEKKSELKEDDFIYY